MLKRSDAYPLTLLALLGHARPVAWRFTHSRLRRPMTHKSCPAHGRTLLLFAEAPNGRCRWSNGYVFASAAATGPSLVAPELRGPTATALVARLYAGNTLGGLCGVGLSLIMSRAAAGVGGG